MISCPAVCWIRIALLWFMEPLDNIVSLKFYAAGQISGCCYCTFINETHLFSVNFQVNKLKIRGFLLYLIEYSVFLGIILYFPWRIQGKVFFVPWQSFLVPRMSLDSGRNLWIHFCACVRAYVRSSPTALTVQYFFLIFCMKLCLHMTQMAKIDSFESLWPKTSKHHYESS